jgi:cell division transport system permease protein
MMRAIQYAFDEALSSLWRGKTSGILSTATITVALFVLGAFLVLTSNLERLGAEWSRTAEMSVYLADGATTENQKGIEALLAPGSVVVEHRFVSKAEALQRFKQTFADLAGAVETLGGNPIPASYEVRLQSGPGAQQAVEDLAGRLRAAPGVSDVRYDRQWLDRLESAVNMLQSAGLLLSAFLTIAAALTVANVVRLALYSRRDEIEIMELVGAPTSYIRGPFVMEGILQGGIGAAAALALLAGGYLVVRGRYLMPLASALNLSSVRFLSLELCLLLLAGGMLVGCLGGIVASGARLPRSVAQP